jgi:hypothetical protein
MKQTALLIAATAVSLSLPDAAAQPRVFAAPPHPSAITGQPQHGGPRVEGRGGRRGPAQFGGDVGLPFAIPFSGPEIVTHDFEDPRDFPPPPYPPRRLPRSVTILEERPMVFRAPPHIIELGSRKHRPPVFVVRRGAISEE